MHKAEAVKQVNFFPKLSGLAAEASSPNLDCQFGYLIFVRQPNLMKLDICFPPQRGGDGDEEKKKMKEGEDDDIESDDDKDENDGVIDGGVKHPFTVSFQMM
ncbi:hypothetical protein DM860_009347 [Cuscuta australis]|uniref:Uncharacterized protein n=1 Tax=Cuscuta australis TaxID=267555 RepID=A0A328DCC7_9ASTE|nr:hypothetical protein DM860_009347 [Cuscuta australis]